MRYRRVSYRYSIVLSGVPAQPWDDPRATEGVRVRFAQTYWRPAADVCESKHGFEVTVDLAGVDQNDVDVVLFKDAVIVEGKRQLPHQGPNVVFHAAEIHQGPFRLELTLPDIIDQDGVEARYEQGLLRLSLPKLRREATT